jgi:hypothetical protein
MSEGIELWMSPSKKVHARRQRWYVGTKDEKPVVADFPIMLCGSRKNLVKVPVSYGVDCLTCLSAMGTGAAEAS